MFQKVVQENFSKMYTNVLIIISATGWVFVHKEICLRAMYQHQRWRVSGVKNGLVVYQTVRPQIIKNTSFKNPTSIARGSIHEHFQKIFKPYSGFVRETGKTRYTLNAIRLASSKFIFVCNQECMLSFIFMYTSN